MENNLILPNSLVICAYGIAEILTTIIRMYDGLQDYRGLQNIINEYLVDPSKILTTPLHIKLGSQ